MPFASMRRVATRFTFLNHKEAPRSSHSSESTGYLDAFAPIPCQLQRGVLVFTAMAKAITHPIKLQPKNRLITKTEPAFETLQLNATMEGRK
jgi:hypothetical protein